ncbi:TPA: hypothetical protein ACGO9F_002005, partial [Streptococcus suis]
VLNGLFFHELENKRASYGPVDHFFFDSRNKRELFSCVIAKMIAIGLHTHELSKLMGCGGKALYFSLFEGMKIYVFYDLCTSNTLRKSKLSVVKSLDELQFYLRLRFLGYF